MKFFRIAVIIISLGAVCFSVFYGGGKIKDDREIIPPKAYRGIISVWQIDSFEGGTGSRTQFLSARAKEYEKTHDGLLFLITSYTVSGAEEQLNKGVFPDVISYGVGLDITPSFKIKGDFAGGRLNGDTFAVPWAQNSYFLISKTEISGKNLDEITVGKGEYNSPLTAFVVSGYTAKKITVKKPLDAYYDFVTGNAKILLGTGRDINRLITRNESAFFTYLQGFCDLYQYVSVLSATAVKSAIAEDFISYLLSESSQKKLNSIGLYSPFYTLGYENGLYLADGKKPEYTLSAFIGKSGCDLLASSSLVLTKEGKTGKDNIKNFLISLD